MDLSDNDLLDLLLARKEPEAELAGAERGRTAAADARLTRAQSHLPDLFI